MDITPLIAPGANIINGYGEDGFVINHKKYAGNLIVNIEEIHPIEIRFAQIDELENCQIFKDLVNKAEIVIIGSDIFYKSKINVKFFRNKIRNFFTKTNSSLLIEVMNSGAACRTYNILLSEGRKVVVLLVSV